MCDKKETESNMQDFWDALPLLLLMAVVFGLGMLVCHVRHRVSNTPEAWYENCMKGYQKYRGGVDDEIAARCGRIGYLMSLEKNETR